MPRLRRPYPPHYRAAFAFSGFLLPPMSSPPSRSGYRLPAGQVGLTQLFRPKMRSEEVEAYDPTGFVNIASTKASYWTYPFTVLVLPISLFGRVPFTSL